MSAGATAWRIGASALAPVLPLHLRRRAARGKEILDRLPERRGAAAAERPAGRLFWLHAASVGELVSILPVIEAMADQAPGLVFLVTTGTVTSATLLQQRLPPGLAARVIHRFLPLDVPSWVERFLDGWRPDAAAFVESELWPNLIAAAARRGLPMALVNARLSPRSFRRWGWARGLARQLLSAFELVLAQSDADAARLAALGAPTPRCLGNLKFAAPALPADPMALAAFRAAVGDRPVLLAASTHPGEEAQLLALHPALTAALPGLLLVVAPRHPERGVAIAEAARAAGFATARRGEGALPQPGEPVHVADTLGELGLLYRVAGAAFIGGSLVRHGGQNPLEPARLGCPILLGPHTWNFEEPVTRLLAAGGAIAVTDAAALAPAAIDVLGNPARAAALAQAAAGVAAADLGLPRALAGTLLRLLPETTHEDAAAGSPDLSSPGPAGGNARPAPGMIDGYAKGPDLAS